MQTVSAIPLEDGRRYGAEATLIQEAQQDRTALGDRHLLTRAVENLVENALRHTLAGGEIRVGWGVEGTQLVVRAADTGPGIATQDLPHLFTPLYRGEASRNRQTGGAGLGLAIARRILRAHGGDLTAANRATGGALFTATLPAGRHAPAPADPVAATVESTKNPVV